MKEKLNEIIFKVDTPKGKLFDVILLWIILLSVGIVFIESVDEIKLKYEHVLGVAEYVFTAIFTVEYILRLYSAKKPLGYALSFFGIIDLLSVLPTFAAILIGKFFPELIPLIATIRVVRVVRLLRIFEVLKLGKFKREANVLTESLKNSKRKIIVFMSTVAVLVTILGSMVYIFEQGKNSDFTNIPQSVYWAIVTVTTVGYGDITPVTSIGKTIASCIMLIGYAIIAVPTGIISAEMVKESGKGDAKKLKACGSCNEEEHPSGAKYCNKCGEAI